MPFAVFPFTSAGEELLPPFSPALPLSLSSFSDLSLPPPSLPLFESCPPRRSRIPPLALADPTAHSSPVFLPPCVRGPGSGCRVIRGGSRARRLRWVGGFAGWLSLPDPSGPRIRRKGGGFCGLSAPCRRVWGVGGEAGRASGLVLALD